WPAPDRGYRIDPEFAAVAERRMAVPAANARAHAGARTGPAANAPHRHALPAPAPLRQRFPMARTIHAARRHRRVPPAVRRAPRAAPRTIPAPREIRAPPAHSPAAGHWLPECRALWADRNGRHPWADRRGRD